MDRHGRDAQVPSQIPRRGWVDIATRVWSEISNDRVLLVAAGVTFYLILALVPSLAAFVALYGLMFDSQGISDQVASFSGLLPSEALVLITEQLTRLSREPPRALSLAMVTSLALAIWGSSSATKALMDGLNIVYDERETRPWWKLNAIALLITIGAIAIAVALLGLSVAMPVALTYLYPGESTWLVSLAGHLLLAFAIWIGVILLYRWGPSREDAKWSWLLPGSLLAVLAILAGSVGFSWYARTFAAYSAYGSLGALIGLLMWLWINTVILLLGAEVNAEIEHQTAVDTTTGAPLPMGMRGATMADTLGAVADRDDPHSESKSIGVAKFPIGIVVLGVVAGVVTGLLSSRP